MSLGDHLSLRRQLRCLQLRPDPICGQDRLRRECRRRPDEHEPGHLLRRPPAGHRHPRANPRCHGNPWASHPGNSAYNATRIQLQAQRSGVSYLLSRVSAAGITDGTASTYLIGEKYLNPDSYTKLGNWTDNRGMYQGEDADTGGWSVNGTEFERLRPTQDRPGLNRDYTFGSPHAGSLQMVFCDGSVRPVPYDIDPQVHARLGNRKDGQVIDGVGP